MTYSFVIKGPPRVRQRVKHGRYGQTYDTNSAVKLGIAKTMLYSRRGQCLEGDVVLNLRFYGLPKGDIDNAVKLILDAGNSVLWRHDRQITELHAWLTREDPQPCTEVTVLDV